MKKITALMLALILTFGSYGTAFAQTVTRGVGYNVVVNGQKAEFSVGDAINVDGATMFTADCYASKFTDAGLTAEVVSKAKAFNFEGANYYSLREVATANGLNVYWDDASSTALVINAEKYEKIKSLIDASNNAQSDLKKAEIEMNGKVNVSMTADGQTQSMEFPIELGMKMDLASKFMEYDIKTSLMGTDIDMKYYDDGEFSYLNSGEEWIKTESQVAKSLDMVEQMKAINPATTALAEELSIAGLKISETDAGYVLEGDMYVSETFNSINLEEMMGEMYSQMGADFDVKFEWPKTMYVKYVMDAEGSIISMSMKFNMDMSITAEGETVSMSFGADINIPKFVLDGEFDTVVPQTVKDTATDFSVLVPAAQE